MAFDCIKFFPLAVDDFSHTVDGIATGEAVDCAGEIWDFEAGIPYYEDRSKQASDSTSVSGQEVSYGNIRWQHDSGIIAGKVSSSIEFDKQNKLVLIKTEPIDSET